MSSVKPAFGSGLVDNGGEDNQLTDVIRVELVHSYESSDSSSSQGPCAEGTQDGELAFVHVVDKNGIKLKSRLVVRHGNENRKAERTPM